MKLKCLVIDDEPLAREGIAEYVKRTGFMELCGTCSSAIEAKEVMSNRKIDVIFLDIEMPGISGLQLIQEMREPPLVILVTAYPDFALKGYDLDVVDYLLKPVAFERFLKAANKALNHFSEFNNQGVDNEYIFIKSDNKYLKIKCAEILYIEGLKDYVKIHIADGTILALVNLKNAESQIPSSGFLRVHKSYIVSLDKIKSVEGNIIHLEKGAIPIGKEYKDALFEKLINRNLIKR